MNKNDIDIPVNHLWLSTADRKSEAEVFIVEAQDQSLVSPSEKKDTSRIRGLLPETVDHLVSRCTLLTSTEYFPHHNRI